jgi:glycosyltransferase involved in cell wall biosynthesis
MKTHHIFPYHPSQLGLDTRTWRTSQATRWPLAAVQVADGESIVHHLSESEQGEETLEGIRFFAHRCKLAGPVYWEWGDDWSSSLTQQIRLFTPNDLCIIHLDSVWSAQQVHRLASRQGCRVAIVAHGMGVPKGHALKADAIIVLRENVRNSLIQAGMPANRIILTRPSVNRQIFQRRDEFAGLGGSRLGFVGMLTAYKGTETLKDTILELGKIRNSESGRRIVVDVIGKCNNLEAHIATDLRDAGSQNVDVILHGQQPAHVVSALMKKWDALLHPSYTEGMPIAVLEALAVGVPVVAVEGVLPREMEETAGVFLTSRAGYAGFVAKQLDSFRESQVDDSLVIEHSTAANVFNSLRHIENQCNDADVALIESRWFRYRPLRNYITRHPQIRQIVRTVRRFLIGIAMRFDIAN